MFGPIDYVAIGFAGNNFNGSILSALKEAVDKNIIRVLDLVFIIKDANGTVVEGEYEDQSDDLKRIFGDLEYREENALPLLTEADIAKLGEQMPADSAAGVLVVEQLWAKDLKRALLDAGGFLIADGRIHPEAAETALKELEMTK